MITKQVADFTARILEDHERRRIAEILSEEERQKRLALSSYTVPNFDRTGRLPANKIYNFAKTFVKRCNELDIAQNLEYSRYLEQTVEHLSQQVPYFELPYLIGVDLLEALLLQERFIVGLKDKRSDMLSRNEVLATHERARKHLLRAIGNFYIFSMASGYSPVQSRRSEIRGQIASSFRREALFRVASAQDSLLETGEYRDVIRTATHSIATYHKVFQDDIFTSTEDAYIALFNMANAMMIAVPEDGFQRILRFYDEAATGLPRLRPQAESKKEIIRSVEAPTSIETFIPYLINICN